MFCPTSHSAVRIYGNARFASGGGRRKPASLGQPLPFTPHRYSREPCGGRVNQRPVAAGATVVRPVLVLEDQFLVRIGGQRSLAYERPVVPHLDLIARPPHGDCEPAGGGGTERPAVADGIAAGVTIRLQGPVVRLLAGSAFLPFQHVDLAV